MEIKIGNIYKVHLNQSEEQLIIVIDQLGDDEYKYIPLVSDGSHGKKIHKDEDINEGSIDTDLTALVTRASYINVSSIKSVVAELKQRKLDQILRELVKSTSKTYYNSVKGKISKNKQPHNYIPPSGKVIDENELYNMIDASLDMWLTTGRFNDKFEKKLSEFIGIKYALTTNSGSSANLLAVTALTSHKLGERRLKPGDEVITVAAGFPTTVSPIIMNNLVPVFVDVELGTYNIDVNQIEESITDKTKAVVVAHTLGNPFDLDKVVELCHKHNLWLIEDNCDALGSKYNGKYSGTFGHISTISFYPAHHITMGEGGAVLTNDEDIYNIILSIRDWGRDCWCKTGISNTCGTRFEWKRGNLPEGYDHKYIYSHLGYNLKITDWQAAIGLAQLDKLPYFIERRKKNYQLIYQGLKEFEDYLILPKATKNAEPSWFGFLITVKNGFGINKNELVKFLETNNVGTRQLFAGNLLRQPALLNTNVKLRVRNSSLINSSSLTEEQYSLLPNTDIVMLNTFWIGLWPGIEISKIDYIINTFKKFFANVVVKTTV